MKFMGDVLKVIVGVFVLVAFVPFLFALVTLIGYYIGAVMGWMTGFLPGNILGLKPQEAGTLIAWLFIIKAIFGLDLSVGMRDKE